MPCKREALRKAEVSKPHARDDVIRASYGEADIRYAGATLATSPRVMATLATPTS